MLRVGVMVSGGGTNLQAILDAVEEGRITNAEIEVVISNNPGAYALERAKNHGIEAVCMSPKDYETRDDFNRAFLEKVDEYHLDLIVLAGFLVKIPEAMVEKYEHRIINIHPSLTGATVHYVDGGMDTGPIILQKAVEVQENDTPELLQRRVMEQAEWVILPKAIDMIANGMV